MECALSMQCGFDASPLDFRIGISLGDVVDDGVDIHGEGVNIAARIEALGQPGDICVTTIVRDTVQNRVSVTFEEMGLHTLKHVSAPVAVFRVVSATSKLPRQVDPLYPDGHSQ
jgi:adenylate cyclase